MPQADHPARPQLTRAELVRGWVFFGLYTLVFPFVVFVVRSILLRALDVESTDAGANGVYYYLCAALVFLLFWSFLKNSFYILLDRWAANLFAFGSGLAGFVILKLFINVLPLPVESPEILAMPEQFALAPATTVIILVVLQPIIEETLFRGLLFGGARKRSRILAWILSVALFALFKVWTYAFVPENMDLRYLLLAVRYLPMSLALTWCYDVGGSIWSAMGLHMVFSAAELWLLL